MSIILITERATSLLYEAQFNDDCVFVRPATPGFESLIESIDWVTYIDRFTEYSGPQGDYTAIPMSVEVLGKE